MHQSGDTREVEKTYQSSSARGVGEIHRSDSAHEIEKINDSNNARKVEEWSSIEENKFDSFPEIKASSADRNKEFYSFCETVSKLTDERCQLASPRRPSEKLLKENNQFNSSHEAKDRFAANTNQFTSFRDLETINLGTLVNVIGMIIQVAEKRVITIKGRTSVKRDVRLLNEEGKSIGITLWRRMADEVISECEVVAFKGMKVAMYNGARQLNSIERSQILRGVSDSRASASQNCSNSYSKPI
eukprot:TRINITY_DN3088_c0_g3_i1.p1 TRINITY_DN3088_c0_g3~~TRINITY_DN3088_c0_g3_i1.p1  ORF type:complete len:244 (-),score=21.47 TRINITY_DN3088_c0_g3_i1:73-804(-)